MGRKNKTNEDTLKKVEELNNLLLKLIDEKSLGANIIKISKELDLPKSLTKPLIGNSGTTWTYENDENFDCGYKPIPELNRVSHNDTIDLMHTKHAIKYDIASERELLMNPDVSDKEKLRILVEKCNQSIRDKNQIMFIIGRVKRPDWHNEIPNLYL